MSPTSQRTRKQSSLLTNTKATRLESGGFCIVRCDPTENDPDGHKASLFRSTHKLASAAGYTSLVRKLTSLRRFDSHEKCICTFLLGHEQKWHLRRGAHFCTRDPTENRTPASRMKTLCPNH